jgi:tRNA (cmo5U34)-methyltransferase
MQHEQLKAMFDQQAASYDQQWSKLAAFRDALHILIGSVFAKLPANSRILCVGAGTGAEIIYLADKFPHWTFTAVEPSPLMLEIYRSRAEEHGFAARCAFHEGYLDSLPATDAFDAATCLLVSQFILEPEARSKFFRTIAKRLKPDAILASSDLASALKTDADQHLLEVWFRTIAGADMPAEGLARMRAAYGRDVAVLPVKAIEEIIVSGGFESPIHFFQAGLIHAWYSTRGAHISGT